MWVNSRLALGVKSESRGLGGRNVTCRYTSRVPRPGFGRIYAACSNDASAQLPCVRKLFSLLGYVVESDFKDNALADLGPEIAQVSTVLRQSSAAPFGIPKCGDRVFFFRPSVFERNTHYLAHLTYLAMQYLGTR